jgi:ATP-dependent exoDNAse (exonuclease V) beta subunit
VLVDAVDLTTIHKAKDLEWAAVFVPSLTTSRSPSSRTGRPRGWLVPRHLFRPQRYEGSDADERRPFYVAMTRARDRLSLARHERITKNRVGASPYHQEVTGHAAYHRSPATRGTFPERERGRQRHPGLLGDRPADGRPVQDGSVAGEECQPSPGDDRIEERRVREPRGW